MIAYTVHCQVPDEATAERYRRWLCDKHLRDVCDAGALSAQLVELDGAVLAFEARYIFADRSSFAAYEQTGAPRLRAEGLALFPASSGVRFERSLGEILQAEMRETSQS